MVDYFIYQKCAEINLLHRPSPAPGAIEKLSTYRWPGNVRELQNIVERALIVSGGGPLRFFDAHTVAQRPLPDRHLPQDRVATLDEVTPAHIRSTLEKTHGRIGGKSGAADLLGVNPSTLRSMLKKIGIPYGRTNNTEN